MGDDRGNWGMGEGVVVVARCRFYLGVIIGDYWGVIIIYSGRVSGKDML